MSSIPPELANLDLTARAIPLPQPHRGGTVLAMSIISLVVCCIGVILGPITIWMCSNDLQAMAQDRMDREGKGLTEAAKICAIVATVLSPIQIILVLMR